VSGGERLQREGRAIGASFSEFFMDGWKRRKKVSKGMDRAR